MLLWQSGRCFCGNPVGAFVAIRSALLWQSGRCLWGNLVGAFVAAEGDAAKECSSLYMQGHQIGVRSCRTGRTGRTSRTAQIECLHTYRAGEGQAAQIGGAPEPGREGWRTIAGERELGGEHRGGLCRDPPSSTPPGGGRNVELLEGATPARGASFPTLHNELMDFCTAQMRLPRLSP